MGSPDKQATGWKDMASIEGVNQRFRDLDRFRREQVDVHRKINNFHLKLRVMSIEAAEKIKPDSWTKLKNLYLKAKGFADEEERVLHHLIALIAPLIAPVGQQTANRKKPASSTADPKRKRMNANSNESPRVAPSPGISRPSSNLISISVGDEVAARISPEDAENHEWIVVKVTGIDRDQNKIVVYDEEPDDDGEGGGRAYTLPTSCIIPFPKKSDANPPPEYPQGSHVLAVYPGTTALYKASVVAQHRKKMKLDDVLLLEFDGDEEDGVEGLPQKPVSLHHVVTLPEGHRQ